MRDFENILPRETPKRKWEKAARSRRKFQNEGLHTHYEILSGDQLQGDEMGVVCDTYKGEEKYNVGICGKPRRKGFAWEKYM